VRRIQEHDEPALEDASDQLASQLELRLSVLEEQIAGVDRHRTIRKRWRCQDCGHVDEWSYRMNEPSYSRSSRSEFQIQMVASPRNQNPLGICFGGTHVDSLFSVM